MSISQRVPEPVRQQVIEAKQANEKLSSRDLGAMFGVHNTTVLKILKQAKKSGFPGPLTITAEEETSERTDDKWVVSIPKTHIHTLEELVEHCKIDLTIWEVERWVCNKWEMGAKDKNDEVQTTPLFQVKAFLRLKRNVVTALAEIEGLRERARNEASSPRFTYIHNTGTKNMLEVNLPDLHGGKMAWGEETGDANYDTKIAVSTFWKALETLLYRVSEHKFDQVLFVVGNDLLNSDDIEGRTTAGTYVSSDQRYQKTFAAIRDLKIQAIERLRVLAPVKVVVVPGNHDALSCWHLGDSLSCYFHKYDDVTVDNSPLFRKYHQFGKVMIMLTHGHKGKRADYPLTMATEQPQMFGDTRFRECHTGHLHTTQVNEHHGVRVRILSALCPPDAWHSQHGFIGNLRSAELFVWNEDEGLIGTALYTENSEETAA